MRFYLRHVNLDVLIIIINTLFSCCDLDPMTRRYEYDLDVMKMYLFTKNELSR